VNQQLPPLNFSNHLTNVGTILGVGQVRVPRAQKLPSLVIQHPCEGGTYGDEFPFCRTKRGADGSTGKKGAEHITFLQKPSLQQTKVDGELRTRLLWPFQCVN
jgi:hypothetical protein